MGVSQTFENESEAKKRIEELTKQINYHNARYYNDDNPEITDYEYDLLTRELRELEAMYPSLAKEDSPTKHVGGSAKREAGVLVRHNVPMLSLQDVFSKEEVDAFVEDIRSQFDNPEFVVEYKIDGLSMTLRYEEGKLVLAETRGDGINFGEDVTANAKVIDDVVTTLKDKPKYLEIRGEVYMKNDDFDKVNETQELLGKKTFANPRNCAAGTLRQLDSAVTKERKLSFFVFNIQQTDGINFASHTEGYEFLKKQGITVIEDYKVCHTADEVWDAIQMIGENRGKLGYDIDGAVVKLNNLEYRETLGNTSKVPRWAVAYKYPPEEKETVLKDIEVSVGRTGRITPTAIFDSIRLCGTNVSRATLHNQDFIDQLDIGIGDTIVVYKSGEIIPKVKGVNKDKRPANWSRFILPANCPICGEATVRDESSADVKCVNPACPAQKERGIINFVGRDAMDIKGFGSRYIVELIDKGYINDIADIYKLKDHRDKLIEEGIIGKEKNTDKLLLAIENSKLNDASALLTGLGIPQIGKNAAKSIFKKFESFDELMNASVDELKDVNDIGDVSAGQICKFFANPNIKEMMAELKALGVNMFSKKEALSSSKLDGLTFVITGTLPNMDRKEAEKLIVSNGGKVTGSVSKKTNYLLAGENAGSKLDKANALGIQVLSENDLKEMIE